MTSEFDSRNRQFIAEMAADTTLATISAAWMSAATRHEYSYHFTWLGVPIIQYPQDLVAVQEIVWRVQPDLIIETGVARGGSVIFYASLLELAGKDGLVIGIDIDLHDENRQIIEGHRLGRRIKLIDGSSTDQRVVDEVREIAQRRPCVFVALDSLHTHDHVLRELELYAPLVSAGSYIVVFDTLIELIAGVSVPGRPWGPGNSPMTAVREFLRRTDRFEIDHNIDAKLQISVAPSGYLKCVKD